jgi:hypothetical protein
MLVLFDPVIGLISRIVTSLAKIVPSIHGIFHEIPLKIPCNSMGKIHEKSSNVYGKFHGIQWNSMEFFSMEFSGIHSMELRLMEFHGKFNGIPWNSVN